MRKLLAHPVFRRLFAAQVVALLGTGLLTVALGLLAYDLAGDEAGIVLGTALAIKMIASVSVSPVVAALAARMPRRTLLVGADAVRLLVALALPFVGAPWQIYGLIVLLQSASATFTPTFQATIPDVLPDERSYTRALTLSRLAYDLEALLSPAVAAALLLVVDFHALFVGTAAGFALSGLLVVRTALPSAAAVPEASFAARLTRGARVFARTAELRALLALDLVVAAATAMVLVNTVVLVQGLWERPASDVALLLAAFGAGSMVVAAALPRLLERLTDRRVMLCGAVAIPLLLAQFALTPLSWIGTLLCWFLLGAATSAVLTPSARLLRRSAEPADRPAVYATQFSASHACFLLTYPIAGLAGARLSLQAASALLAGLAAIGLLAAALAWQRPSGLSARKAGSVISRPHHIRGS